MNVNRFNKMRAAFKRNCFVDRVEYAHNNKIKRNKKKKGGNG